MAGKDSLALGRTALSIIALIAAVLVHAGCGSMRPVGPSSARGTGRATASPGQPAGSAGDVGEVLVLRTRDPYQALAARLAARLPREAARTQAAVLLVKGRDRLEAWHLAALMPVHLAERGVRCLSLEETEQLLLRNGLSIWVDLSPADIERLSQHSGCKWVIEVTSGSGGVKLTAVEYPGSRVRFEDTVGPVLSSPVMVRPVRPPEGAEATILDALRLARQNETISDPKTRCFLAEGDLFYRLGFWARAEACYSAVSPKASASAGYFRLLALTHLSGQGERARELHAQMEGDDGDGPAALACQAFLHEKEGRSEEAERLLADAAKRDWRAALLYSQLWPGDTAEALLHDAIQSGAKQAALLNALARARLNANDDAGMRLAEQALRLDPDSSAACTLLANAAMVKGDHAGAERYARKAIALDATNESAYETLAGLLLWRRAYTDVTSLLETGTRLVPYSEVLWIRLGENYARVRRLADAERAFRQALLQREDLDFARAKIVETKLAQHKYEEALAEVAHLKNGPRNPRTTILKARALAGRGDPAEAVELLRTVVRKPEDEVEGRLWLSRVYERMGNREAALSEAQLAASRADHLKSPAAGLAYARLADVVLLLGQTSDADGASAEAMKRSPGSPPIMLTRARVLLAKGEIAEAGSLAEACRRVDAYNPQVHVLMGELAVREQKWAPAAESWKTACTLDPTDEGTCWNLAELYLAKLHNVALARTYYALCVQMDGARAARANKMLETLAKRPSGTNVD